MIKSTKMCSRTRRRESRLERNKSRARTVPKGCATRHIAATAAALQAISAPRHRAQKHHFDQRAGLRAPLDMELPAVGFDQRLGQRQNDAGAFGGLIRWGLRSEWLHGGCDLVVVEPLAAIADPQDHFAEIRQR